MGGLFHSISFSQPILQYPLCPFAPAMQPGFGLLNRHRGYNTNRRQPGTTGLHAQHKRCRYLGHCTVQSVRASMFSKASLVACPEIREESIWLRSAKIFNITASLKSVGTSLEKKPGLECLRQRGDDSWPLDRSQKSGKSASRTHPLASFVTKVSGAGLLERWEKSGLSQSGCC